MRRRAQRLLPIGTKFNSPIENERRRAFWKLENFRVLIRERGRRPTTSVHINWRTQSSILLLPPGRRCSGYIILARANITAKNSSSGNKSHASSCFLAAFPALLRPPAAGSCLDGKLPVFLTFAFINDVINPRVGSARGITGETRDWQGGRGLLSHANVNSNLE